MLYNICEYILKYIYKNIYIYILAAFLYISHILNISKYIYIYIYIQVNLNKLECRGKVHLFQ